MLRSPCVLAVCIDKLVMHFEHVLLIGNTVLMTKLHEVWRCERNDVIDIENNANIGERNQSYSSRMINDNSSSGQLFQRLANNEKCAFCLALSSLRSKASDQRRNRN
jgi:hypothetical protein